MQRESVTVLEECIDLQKRKSQDYQNPNSNIVQAMHYRRGLSSIHDMISQKLLRAQSLIEPMENGESRDPNFESIEDTYKDLINYASFAVSYIRGKMEGQDPNRDIFNRAKISDNDLIVKAHEALAKEPVLFPDPTRIIKSDPSRPQGIGSSTYRVDKTIDTDGQVLYCTTPVSDIGDRMNEDILDHLMNVARNIGPQ